MFKDKLKNMLQGKKKTENLIVLLIILIVTVVVINYIWKDNNITDSDNKMISNSVVEVNSNATTQDDTETKLENILSKISGVGKVKVMITYSQSSTTMPIYNQNSKITNTTETDGDGGSRSISEEDNQKEVIYKEKNDGTKEPITQSVISPKVEGAIIAADGAGNDEIKADIIQAVEAATGLATHKIQVFKMQN